MTTPHEADVVDAENLDPHGLRPIRCALCHTPRPSDERLIVAGLIVCRGDATLPIPCLAEQQFHIEETACAR